MATTHINDQIEIERVGAVGLICINNPPVNACGQLVRAGMIKALALLNTDDTIKVIAFYAAGRTFVAGADIREFGKPPLEPGLPDVCEILEASAKPVITVLHGTTLGGGLEIALATHARVGITGLRIGLPEVLLGILPGASGTQRTPRLIGIPAALDVILSGRQTPANEALEMGLIDTISDTTPREAALTAAADVISGSLKTRRTGALTVSPDQPALDAALARVTAKSPHLINLPKIIAAISASTGPLTEGLKQERKLFSECLNSEQSAGLRHAFFAERAVSKVPESKETPRDIKTIGVIGGGTMGSGIATSALLSGLQVTLVEVAQEGLDRGVATITKNLNGAVKRGKLSAEKLAPTLNALSATINMNDLANVDLVVEAVFENMDVKKDIFGKLDTICKPGAILASNTSYLDINEIAAATNRPQDVLGLHFFSPAHVMRLLEIVVADKTAADVVSSGFALAKKMRKIGVRAGVCDGFIGNRILQHYLKVTTYMMMDGASPEQIDKALQGFGLAMGPFAVSDLAGIDIGWANRKRIAADRPAEERYIAIADKIAEQGWFGRKTGQGYYIYDAQGTRPNPEATKIIEAERTAAGIIPRNFTDQEIIDRYMTAMISEAARVVEDGIALRPIDVNAVFLFGYGFPRFRGGPLHYADTIGAAELVRRIEAYAKEDSHYWQVPALLRKMAADGSSFADLNS